MEIGDSVIIEINPYPYLREIQNGVIVLIRTDGIGKRVFINLL
jgi:hypothetical protein